MLVRGGGLLPLIVTFVNPDCVLSVASTTTCGWHYNYAHDVMPAKNVVPCRFFVVLSV